MSEAMAHLDHLLAQGRLRREQRAGAPDRRLRTVRVAGGGAGRG